MFVFRKKEELTKLRSQMQLKTVNYHRISKFTCCDLHAVESMASDVGDASFVSDINSSFSDVSDANSSTSTASDSSFYSANEAPSIQSENSFQVPKFICKNRIEFVDPNQNIRIRIDCQEEQSSAKDNRQHKMKCLTRNQSKAFKDAHQHETASLIWNSLKANGLAAALVKVINDDLTNNTLVEHGITKLRTDVGVKHCNLYALKNSSSLHCVKKQEKNVSRRGRDEIELNSDDLRLIAGPGASINSITRTVRELRNQNIPVSRGVVNQIRSERQSIRSMTENIVINNVQRRTKNKLGSSHLGLVEMHHF